MHKVLYNYTNEHKLLTPFQSALSQETSRPSNYFIPYHMFCEAVDGGKEVHVVFCDISKAFDRGIGG